MTSLQSRLFHKKRVTCKRDDFCVHTVDYDTYGGEAEKEEESWGIFGDQVVDGMRSAYLIYNVRQSK
ncbi:hypothetical protein OUZ56_022745 [Daphnia magna]|uniref:Uncharacterized protein n=1 Tax=Daphnia magna TaxID=35525 RepID=A0ABR0AXF8_9CRUS|nr:hypothetical protein OUZ56_022745 [Daphnia magna]